MLRHWAGSLAAMAFMMLLRTVETLIRLCSKEGRRVYFDTAAFPWTVKLEAATAEIVAELDAVLMDRAAIPAFHEVSPEQRVITDDDRWKSYVFQVFGTRIDRNCRRCPRTAELIDGIPGLRNAMFSILAPGKHIPEHRGPYNGLLRFHLPLKVPSEVNACTIDVAGERRSWSLGRSLIFDDSFPHSVRNESAEERVVLFADFERPLPALLRGINRLVLALLAWTPMIRNPIKRFEAGQL